jgi:hypothetical protein
LAALIEPFLHGLASGQVEIYNEFSLQHGLGFFLRQALPSLKVQFERNVRFFFPALSNFVKREIDIAIFQPDSSAPQWAIELKSPRNKQYPEQMFSFCRDVLFAEQLRAAGFAHAGLVLFAEDKLFWQGAQEGIYRFFRSTAPLEGVIVHQQAPKTKPSSFPGAIPWNGKTSLASLSAL